MVGNIYLNNFKVDSIAFKFKGNTITYGQLDTNVKKYTNFFKNFGVKPGERVILSCPNSPEFIYSYLGVVSTGAVIVPTEPQGQ